MSSLYLFDAHNPIVDQSRITDVVSTSRGRTNITGSFVVRIPTNVGLQDQPATLPDLLDKKYAAILASFPGFSRIVFDALLDDSKIDRASSTGILLGARGSISMQSHPDPTQGPLLVSNALPLGAGAPPQAIVTWEVARISLDNPIGRAATRFYLEASAAQLVAEVTFNGGSSWLPALDGGVVSIPLASQGTQFRVRFRNPSGERLWLGSWALIY